MSIAIKSNIYDDIDETISKTGKWNMRKIIPKETVSLF